jgi:putative tryptophan/tyrosine transport system substrate-binding protein
MGQRTAPRRCWAEGLRPWCIVGLTQTPGGLLQAPRRSNAVEASLVAEALGGVAAQPAEPSGSAGFFLVGQAPAKGAAMDSRLTRRRWIQGTGAVGLGLLAGCGRWPGQGQQPAKVPRIGFLAPGAPQPQHEAFREGLRALGYVEGQNITIEHRSAEGREERLPELAAELVQLRADVILAAGTPAAVAGKQGTNSIPIVFGASNEPVEAGLVASLARPGGNVTGLSLMNSQLSAKRLEILKEAVPAVSRVAVLAWPLQATVERDWNETQVAAQALDLQMQRLDVQRADEFASAFEAAIRKGADALVVLPNSFFARERVSIIELAAMHRLPAMYEQRQFAEAGGLVAYGANLNDLYRRAATYVDKILKGVNPTDLPVEQPTTFDFVINLKTAGALGLTIPHHVLLQATEVIQ